MTKEEELVIKQEIEKCERNRKKIYSFNYIRKHGYLLYEYIRGSQCHGINTATSDIDTGAVFISPINNLYGFNKNIITDIKSAGNDDDWWEIGKFMEQLSDSNPSAIEALFVDDDMVLYEHPLFTEIKKHRNEFITKACFKPFGGQMTAQVKKARGEKKMITWDQEDMKRKTPMDFCYTFFNQGSTPMQEWLNENGLKSIYCGLVKVPNMPCMYSVFYDYGMHAKYEGIPVPGHENDEPIGGYSGIIKPNSNDVRLSSVKKGASPICFMSYNKDGYISHCRKYKEYLEWKENRNPVRYESNLLQNYDGKNMCEAIRTINMCLEIAKTGEVHVNRRHIDRELLLDIKSHKFTYDEIMQMIETKSNELNELIPNAPIPEKVNIHYCEQTLIKIRQNFYLSKNIQL